MLDYDHPQSQWIVAASRQLDAILEHTKLMTLLPTEQRRQILGRVTDPIERLRKLNKEHFDASAFIEDTLSNLEASCSALASLQSTESRLDGHGACPVCGTGITHFPEYFNMTYCGLCHAPVQNALQSVESAEGFGTFAI